jgi:hypothetical protein
MEVHGGCTGLIGLVGIPNLSVIMGRSRWYGLVRLIYEKPSFWTHEGTIKELGISISKFAELTAHLETS